MEEPIRPAELVVIGVELANAARAASSEHLARMLDDAGARLVDAGLGRM